jgi:hypothetical protein
MKSERTTSEPESEVVDYGNHPLLLNRFYIDSRFGLSYVAELSSDILDLEQGPNGHIGVGLADGPIEFRREVVKDTAGRLMHLSNYDLRLNYGPASQNYKAWIKERLKTLARSPIKGDLPKRDILKLLILKP